MSPLDSQPESTIFTLSSFDMLLKLCTFILFALFIKFFGEDRVIKPAPALPPLHRNIHWNVRLEPEKAQLVNPRELERKDFPPCRLSDVLFENQTSLRVYDRVGIRRTTINVKGSLEEVMKELQRFYEEMSSKFEETYGHEQSWFDDYIESYEAEDLSETGFYVDGDGITVRGIIWRNGCWELDTQPGL